MRILRTIKSRINGVEPVRRKNPKDIFRIANSNRWRIVDIRPAAEFHEYRIATSENIPILKMERKFTKLIPMDEKVLLVCRNGYLCASKFKELYNMGYNVFLLKGGINGLYKTKYNGVVYRSNLA